LLALIFATLGLAGSSSAADSAIEPLSPSMQAAMMGKSWSPGCPVPLADLRAVHVSYVGFDGQTHAGIVVAHKRFAQAVADIFSDLNQARFPIHKIDTYDAYGSKYAENDITVGFYCRKADDDPTEWSSHAYGMAIDVNPLENPFLNAKGEWWPESAAKYGPRDAAIGKITTSSSAFAIFTRHGWIWGGLYTGERDYMHFNVIAIGGRGNPLERPYVVDSLQYVPGGAFEASGQKN
jgi:hypothetical protein